MYADLTRMMMPSTLRDAMLEQGRRSLAFQKELVSWQLAQVKTAEDQVNELWKLSLDNTRKAWEQAVELQDKALSAMTPKSDESVEA